MDRTNDSEAFRALLDQILAAAKDQGVAGKELAVRAGITPETLSRMKRRGSGDAAVLNALARVVGLRLSLVPDDERLEAIRRGSFF